MLQRTLPSPSIANVSLLPAIWSHHKVEIHAALQGKSANKLQVSQKRTRGPRPNCLPRKRVPSSASTTLGDSTFASVSRPCISAVSQICTKKGHKNFSADYGRLASWPSSATPQPNTTASIGGAVTKLGNSAHKLPTEDGCRLRDFVTLLVLRLGVLLDDLEPGCVGASGCLLSACTIRLPTTSPKLEAVR